MATALTTDGTPTTRTAVVRWRAGERTAPLGLLPVVLSHVDDPAAVLDVLARPLGLRVVPDRTLASDERPLGDRALEIAERAGMVISAVRSALAGDPDPDRIGAAARSLRRSAAELEAIAREPSPEEPDAS